ncbi:ribosomal protein S9/S16-domain-containing protein [Naematelia encephala]|uniref:Ribosomal protein S9/S16-domain-containing protein n=1 Tax=Naematelia encephala TaxID=71784 RepID=A0A1Y2BLD3_9TREE|nr:ribosomal protein S9/S16-domain-containing protein [Naematelia encephala]
MASTSTSTLRCLRLSSTSTPLSSLSHTFRRNASTDSYPPRFGTRDIDDIEPPSRPPRPSSPHFFSGRPQQTTEVTALEDLLNKTQRALRTAHVYPLPASLTMPQLPEVRWKTASELSQRFGRQVNNSVHRRVTTLLNELNRMRYLAEVGGRSQVAQKVSNTLDSYSRGSRYNSSLSSKDNSPGNQSGIDEFGRAQGVGRRKEASARVWIVPSQNASTFLDAPFEPFRPAENSDFTTSLTATSTSTLNGEKAILPTSEILINHLPLPAHFPRPIDREKVIRPLRLTGLLGAYNVFVLARGGGTTGQADAIAMGLARALVAMRQDAKDVLFAAGLLMRDTRMVERKKTGRPKARKKSAWVKR